MAWPLIVQEYARASPSGSDDADASNIAESPSRIVYGPPAFVDGGLLKSGVETAENSDVPSGPVAVAVTISPTNVAPSGVAANVLFPKPSVVTQTETR